MKRPFSIHILAACAALAAPSPGLAAGLCPAWSEPERAGELNVRMIGEASGLEAAGAAGRLYLHNDSGDGPHLYVTDAAGGDARRIVIAGLDPRDAEDMSAGPCGAETCLFLGDIGDNATRRRSVRIAVIPEPNDEIPGRLTPLKIIEATYPDGAHNAEAMAVHPNGDLFVLAKTRNPRGPGLYRLTAAQIAAGGEQSFEFVTRIAAGLLPESRGDQTHEATAMDIAPDGARFMVLTYLGAVEFAADLSGPIDPETWREGEDWRRIRTALLPQSEAIAYAPDGRSILYTTESVRRFGAPLMRQTCVE